MSTATIDAPAPAVAPPAPKPRKKGRMTMLLSAGWIALVAIHAVLNTALPWVSEHDKPGTRREEFGVGPSWDHWFGTDKLGRDVFSRCVYGSRLALLIAVLSVVIGLGIATVFGLLAGYFRGWTDRIISIVADVLLAFPPIILLMSLTSFLDQREVLGIVLTRRWLVIGGLAILAVPTLTRVVRANTMVYSQREFVLAARSLGAKHGRVIFREILPNIVPSLVSFAMTALAVLVIAEGGLAFIGQSVQPPDTTWGKLIQDGSKNIEDQPWVSLAPAIVLFLTVLAFNLLGDVLSKRFDIKESLA